jgi:Tol biopolymer transport system component
MNRARELAFGALAIALLVAYASLASRIGPAFIPPESPTPTPPKPVERVPTPSVTGTLAFAIRGDIYVLSGGGYVPVTFEGRSHQPSLSPDGATLLFARIEEVEGRRIVDNQVVPARLRFSNVVRKAASGGTETVLMNGFVQKPNGFHLVTWFDAPALSPDGKRVAVVADDGDGYSDLEVFDVQTGARTKLSDGANLADPSWSPDGKTIAVTSYTKGNPRLVLVSVDGRSSDPVALSGEGEPYQSSYSPDGAWLVYTVRQEGRNDLHAVQVSGGKDVALSSDGKSWNGVFSPDGRQLAFLRERDGTIDLYFMELADALNGGSPKPATKLTHGEGIDGASQPSWGS